MLSSYSTPRLLHRLLSLCCLIPRPRVSLCSVPFLVRRLARYPSLPSLAPSELIASSSLARWTMLTRSLLRADLPDLVPFFLLSRLCVAIVWMALCALLGSSVVVPSSNASFLVAYAPDSVSSLLAIDGMALCFVSAQLLRVTHVLDACIQFGSSSKSEWRGISFVSLLAMRTLRLSFDAFRWL